MTLMLCIALSVVLRPCGPDTAGWEYGENQTKINSTPSTIPYPITKAYRAQFVSVIP